MMIRTTVELRAEKATYADVAREYYDPVRHPTCASLRELSANFLRTALSRLSGNEELLLEVGTGKSILAPACLDIGLGLDKLLLTDSSAEMLDYSAEWKALGADLRICDAQAIDVETASVNVVVSSLGDPYNTAGFWREVGRVLRPGGVCYFTAPSIEWASRFRPSDQIGLAEFITANGSRVFLPSNVPDERRQLDMIQDAGLKIIESAALYLRDLRGHPAPKLLCAGPAPVVRGLSVRR